MKTKIRGLQWMTLLLVACLFTSCAKSLQYWNQAITHFEQGAELEVNQYAKRLNAQEDIPEEVLPNLKEVVRSDAPAAPATGEAGQQYLMADEKVSKALSAPGPLKKEQKLANALTLKALTSWKTQQAEEARTNSSAALQAFGNHTEASPRDKPLAKAVPGLVALDMAYDSTVVFIERLKTLSDTAPNTPKEENEIVLAEGKRLYRKFVQDEDSPVSIANAQLQLEQAKMLANDNQQIQLYFELCGLTGLKNRYDFWAQLNNFARRSRLKGNVTELASWLDDEKSSYDTDSAAALVRLKAMLGGSEQHQVYRFWDNLL